jgi:hypothetical protein
MNKKLILTGIWTLFQMMSFAQQEEQIPFRNRCVIDTMTQYGPAISSTYQKAVCTELVIKIVEKFYSLDKKDKSRIRIITDQSISGLLANDSPIPKGLYYALTTKGIATSVDKLEDVLPGDFVQFWTDLHGWGHCGVVKSIDVKNRMMELYSSFPTTDGYGILWFAISPYSYFVRLK